ncbi:MAG: CRISPR-associated endonuclease Cas2 [Bacteroidales bacterium]|jgi:CRISPR-associated protein Cas2
MIKQMVVVAYDIVNNKRRNKVAGIMGKYGQRCNLSVFECFLTEREIALMQSEIIQIINVKEDSVLYYYLCVKCIKKAEYVGKHISKEKDVYCI